MGQSEHNLTALWVEVLVDCPGATGLYTYRMPAHTAVQPGDIVSVSFGTQQVGAIAVGTLHKSPEGIDPSSIKTIESIVNPAFFTREYWQLLNCVSRYYQTSFIKVIKTALPPGLLSRSQRRIRLVESKQVATIDSLSISETLSEGAIELIDILNKSPQKEYSWQYLRQQMKAKRRSVRDINSTLRMLIGKGLVKSYLAPPRSPQAQKRQAVVLIRTVPTSGDEPDAGTDDELSKRQREILTALAHHSNQQQSGGELWLSDALQLLRTTSKTLKAIADRGYLVVEPREVLRSGSHSGALPDQAKALTADQAAALGTIHEMAGYSEALLHGVTGSGKTEVYLQAIAPLLAAGKSALVLVPEIGLTPQLTDRFRSRFGEKVCVYHSGLSEGERYDTWRQMLTGSPQVIIGTRSAVFSPLPNIGIIILDEEHDSSFKQDQPMPCYHARQVARWRAELEQCPLILGSATPAAETWVRFVDASSDDAGDLADREASRREPSHPEGRNALAPLPPLHYLAMPQRVHARPMPPIEIIDMRTELHEGNRTIFSRPLQKALEELVEKGEQGILFIHRRGHSSFVSCRSCGHVMECPHCDVSLSFHQTHEGAAEKLKCHYCGYGKNQPSKCPECASPYLKNFGSGTQRVVNDLARYLPQAKCIRFDSDTTRNKGAHRALLTRFAQGEADLLVGTQMLTKGIDLPQVTLVGVIAADGLLFMPDYRASERAFQTMTQVAGRAGRGDKPGRVIVQTYSPNHLAVEALLQQAESPKTAYGDFLQTELCDREALNYPPYGRLVLLRMAGIDEHATERAAQRIAHQLSERLAKEFPQPLDSAPDLTADPTADLAGDPIANSTTELGLDPMEADPPYSVMGPVPAPIFRVARRYRWHILVKLGLAVPLPDLGDLLQQTPKGISLSIDVDPLNLS